MYRYRGGADLLERGRGEGEVVGMESYRQLSSKMCGEDGLRDSRRCLNRLLWMSTEAAMRQL